MLIVYIYILCSAHHTKRSPGCTHHILHWPQPHPHRSRGAPLHCKMVADLRISCDPRHGLDRCAGQAEWAPEGCYGAVPYGPGYGSECDSLVPGSGQCTQTCESGYTKTKGAGVYICLHGILIGERIVCVDVDECAVGNNNCTSLNAKCINQAGSFACVCNDGFVGDGHTCTEHAPLHKSILCYVEEFELTPPSSTADRVCAPLTICADDEYEV